MYCEPRDYLQHILIEADYLISQCADLTPQQFMADQTLRVPSSGVWKSSIKRAQRHPIACALRRSGKKDSG